mgnify:CR=1 FL=1
MVDDAPPDSDRRRGLRHLACFPAFLERGGDDSKTIAMIGDLAVGGARLLLRKPDLNVADSVRLELHVALDDDAPPRIAVGQVLRIEALPDDRASLWTHEVGIEFHQKIELSADEIEALERRQEPFGKRRTNPPPR